MIQAPGERKRQRKANCMSTWPKYLFPFIHIKTSANRKNLGRVFNSRRGCKHHYEAKWPSLKLKMLPKQLVCIILLHFVLLDLLSRQFVRMRSLAPCSLFVLSNSDTHSGTQNESHSNSCFCTVVFILSVTGPVKVTTPITATEAEAQSQPTSYSQSQSNFTHPLFFNVLLLSLISLISGFGKFW